VPSAISAIGIFVMIRSGPRRAARRARLPMREKLAAIATIWPIMVLVVTFGGIYAGGRSPPARVGAARSADPRPPPRARQPARLALAGDERRRVTSCIIFLNFIGGLLFAHDPRHGVVDVFADRLVAFSTSPLVLLDIVTILLLILGMFIDTTSMMLVTLPFIFPASQKLGIDPIWFGILIVKLVEIGVLTPPVGLNLFAVMSVVDKDTTWSDLIRGVVPFILLELIVLGLLVIYPELSLWLPRKMLER
jgi:TRAP-type C4-dicarboxylate transport system permease large subunit